MARLPDAQLTRLAVANQHRMSTYAKRVGDNYGRMFRVVGGADGDAEMAWVRFAAPTMQATQAHVVRTQESYVRLMSQGLGLETDGAIDRAGLVDDLDALVDRYTSPIINVRSLLGDGTEFGEAVDQASRQATEMARTDVADTTRDAATTAMTAQDGIVAYRRVPSPSACEFCLLIAGQTYRTDDLAPSHNNCTCGIAPITDEADPTFARAKALSKDIYASQQGGAEQ